MLLPVLVVVLFHWFLIVVLGFLCSLLPDVDSFCHIFIFSCCKDIADDVILCVLGSGRVT